MKIYNKKTFYFGFSCILLSLLNLITSFFTGIEFKTVILALLLMFFGLGSLRRCFSSKLSFEDKLDELDERNRLIDMKSKSKSFTLTQAISFILMLAMLIMGKLSGYEGFIGIAVGLAFAFTISMFAEIAAYFYYESKN